MAEFFVDVPGVAKDHKRLKKLIDCCEKLQAALGAIRDEEAMAEFMENEVWMGADAANGLAKTAILAGRSRPASEGRRQKRNSKRRCAPIRNWPRSSRFKTMAKALNPAVRRGPKRKGRVH